MGAPAEAADHYPACVEKYWVRQVEQAYPEHDRGSALAQLDHPIRQLSDLFTCDRPKTYKNYGAAAETLLGYGIFFYPQTWTRVRYPVIEAHELRGWRAPHGRPIRILDIGSGMGAASASLAHLAIARLGASQAHITCVDHSGQALVQTHAVAATLREHGTPITIETRQGDFRKNGVLPEPKNGTYDLIVISFALNEAFGSDRNDDAYAWIRRLKPLLDREGLLLITEPALRTTAEFLYQLTDRVATDGLFHVWGPQLHNGPCPAHYTGKYWSHEVRPFSPPPSLEWVNRKLFRGIHDLKFSFSILGLREAKAFPPSKLWIRLASPMSQMKGHFLFTGIASDGEKYTYDLPTRGYNKDELVAIQSIQRGDTIEVETVDPLSQHLRVPRPEAIIYHYQAR